MHTRQPSPPPAPAPLAHVRAAARAPGSHGRVSSLRPKQTAPLSHAAAAAAAAAASAAPAARSNAVVSARRGALAKAAAAASGSTSLQAREHGWNAALREPDDGRATPPTPPVNQAALSRRSSLKSIGGAQEYKEGDLTMLQFPSSSAQSQPPLLPAYDSLPIARLASARAASIAQTDSLGVSLSDPAAASSLSSARMAAAIAGHRPSDIRASARDSVARSNTGNGRRVAPATAATRSSLDSLASTGAAAAASNAPGMAPQPVPPASAFPLMSPLSGRSSMHSAQLASPARRSATTAAATTPAEAPLPSESNFVDNFSPVSVSASGAGASSAFSSPASLAEAIEMHGRNGSYAFIPSRPVLRSLDALLSDPLSPSSQHALFEAGGVACFARLVDLRSQRGAAVECWKDLSEVRMELTRLRTQQEAAGTAYRTVEQLRIPLETQESVLRLLSAPSCPLLSPRPAAALCLADLAPLFAASGAATLAILEQLQSSVPAPAFPSVDGLAQALGSFTLRAGLHLLLLQRMLLPGVSQTIAGGGIELAQRWFEQGAPAAAPSQPAVVAAAAAETDAPAAVASSSSPQIVRGPAVVSLLQSFAQSRRTFASVEALHSAMQSAVAPASYHSSKAAAGLSPRKQQPLNRSASVASAAAAAQQQLLDLFNSPSSASPTLLPRTDKHGQDVPPVTLATPQLQQLLQIMGAPEVAVLYLQEILRVRRTGLLAASAAAAAPAAEVPASSSATPAALFNSWSSLSRLCRRLKAREAALRSFLASPSDCTILPPPPVGFNSTAAASSIGASSPRGVIARSFRPMEIAHLALVGAEDVISSVATKHAAKPNAGSGAAPAPAPTADVDSDSEDGAASASADEQRALGASVSQQNLAAATVSPATPSAAALQASVRLAFLRSNPLIAVIQALQRDSSEVVADIAALIPKVRKLHSELREQRGREIERLREILEGSKGSLLAAQVALEEAEVARMHDAHADVFAAAAMAPRDGQLARSPFDTLLSRIDALLPSAPRFASLSALDAALCQARESFESARRDLYAYLHSPACPLWPAKGGGKLVYAECSYATIDSLLATVGPLPSDVTQFLSTLSDSKTRCASAAALLDLAREHTEVRLAIATRRQKVARMTREYFIAFLLGDTADADCDAKTSAAPAQIFKQKGFANEQDRQAYATLSDEQRQHAQEAYSRQVLARLSAQDDATQAEVNSFLVDCGVKHTTAAWAAPESEGSVHTLCALVTHLLYLGRSYEGLDAQFKDDLVAQAARLTAEKRAALKFIQSTSGAPSASSAVAAGLGQSGSRTNLSLSLGLTMKASTSRSSLALGLSQPNTPRGAATAAATTAGSSSAVLPSDEPALVVHFVQPALALAWTLADMDTLFHTAGSAGVNAGRVAKDLHAAQYIAVAGVAGKDAPAHNISAEPFESLAALAVAIAAHHSSVFLPLRRSMHSKLLSVLGPEAHSALLGSDASCGVEEVDDLLDRTVAARALHLAKTGVWAELLPTAAQLEWIASVVRMPLEQIADPAVAQLVSLQTMLFFETLQTLALLEEGQNLTCDSVAELGEEIVAFHAEQRASLASYLQQRSDEIFDPTVTAATAAATASSSSSALDFTDGASADTLDLILRGFAGQAFLCTRFMDSLLSKARARAQRQEALAREAMKAQGSTEASATSFELGGGRSSGNSFSATMHQSVAVFRRCSSLQALHSQLCTLQNQSASTLRKLQDKLSELRLLHQPSLAFTEPDASELFDILAAVAPEKQMDVASGVIQTLAQRASDARVEAEVLSGSSAVDSDSGDCVYASVVELLEAVRELVTQELDSLCQFLAEDGAVAGLLSEKLLASLSEESEALERMWVSVDGLWTRVRSWVQSSLRATAGAAPKPKPVQSMAELLDQLHTSNDDQMEAELALKSSLYSAAILAPVDSAAAASSSPPNRVSLRKIIALCEELESSEPEASQQRSQFLQGLTKDHHGGQPFASIVELQRALFRLVSKERLEQARLAAEAAERARLAAEAELARQKAEEEAAAARALAIVEAAKAAERALAARRDAIAHLRSYLLAEECSLFPKSRRVAQLELAADLKKKDALGPGAAVLSPLLTAAREELPTALRALDALQSLHQTFQYPSSPEFLAAFSAQVAHFDASCSDFVAWFSSPAAALVLPEDARAQWSVEKEGVQIMEAFDKEAQMGAGHVLRLADIVSQALIDGRAVDSHSSAAAPAEPAFSSLAALLASMRAHRATELASLEAWLGTPSAETLFLKPEELEASAGSLLRLLLAADSWHAVRQALRSFQAQSRQFESLESLAAAVTQHQATREREEAAVLDWLESGSGLLKSATAAQGPESSSSSGAASLSSRELSQFRSHMLVEGVSRTQNELINLQQDCIAGVGPAAGYTGSEMVAALRNRSIHAIQSLRAWMTRADGGRRFYAPASPATPPPSDADLASLLDAVIDPSQLGEALQTLHASFAELDMLSLAVRRLVQGRWTVHARIQAAVEKQQVLAAAPQAQRTLLLSFFDTSFLLSLVPDPSQLESLLAAAPFKSARFASIESLVEEVQRCVERGSAATAASSTSSLAAASS